MTDVEALEPFHPKPLRVHKKSFFHRFSHNILFIVFLGQVISLLNALSSVSTELLFVRYQIEIPELQTFFTYVLLMLVCTPCMLFYYFKGEFESNQIMDFPYLPWYILAAFLDFEANYWVIYSFQYIGMLNVTLILCLTTPFVMIFTVLKMKNLSIYRPLQYIGICIALVGVGILVFVPEARAKLSNLGIINSVLQFFDDLNFCREFSRWLHLCRVWGDHVRAFEPRSRASSESKRSFDIFIFSGHFWCSYSFCSKVMGLIYCL